MREQGAWFDNFLYTYLLLEENARAKDLEAKLPAFADRHMGELMDELKMHYTFSLQPLKSIYLRSDLRYEIGATGNVTYLRIFSLVGLFILLLACINYMNLATARSSERSHEIGIRKIMGAPRSQLIIQFLGESILLAFFAFVMSLMLIELSKPLFYRLTDYPTLQLFSKQNITLLLGATLFAGLFSGFYPAMIITANRILPALRGATSSSRYSGRIRKGLVVIQFCISVGMITAVLAVQAQMNFIRSKDLGFNQENLMLLRVNGIDEVRDRFPGFRAELTKEAGIKSITTSNSSIIGGLENGIVETVNKNGKPVSSSIYRLRVGYDYLDVHQIQLLAGRSFSPDFPADTLSSFLINEAAISSFGWKSPEEAIGKPIYWNDTEGRIIGVTKNFHFNSLHHQVEPLMFFFRPNRFSQITLRTEGISPAEAVNRVERVWKAHFSNALFDYSFYDQRLVSQYQSDARFAVLFRWFSWLSLLIACLGLLGLAAFSAEKRAKEISVRKVLGASVTQLLVLLNRDFLRLVLLAITLATPLAWYGMNKWLNNFAYRIPFQWWMVVLAGGLAILIAVAAVSMQSIRTALCNPVDSLRNE